MYTVVVILCWVVEKSKKKHEHIISESVAQAQPISKILKSTTGLVCSADYQPARFATMKFNNTENVYVLSI